jgi:predicted ribosome quality control (RQC) complex YloA/Tae2 family protein
VFVPVASISQAVEQFYTQRPVERPVASQDTYAGLRTTVAAAVQRAQQRVERQLAALAGDEPPPGAAEQMRSQAEWLLALHNQIEPGQAELVVDLGDQTLRIALDGQKTAVEQAEQMFKSAAKWERAAHFIPERRATLQADLAFLAQLSTDLALAENQPEIAAVREELDKGGFLPVPQHKERRERVNQAAAQPRRYYSPQGFAILVGRNARQNEQVTFALAQGEDLWLHVRNAPGSHVVIRNAGQTVSDETLQLAAQLAAYYSSLRGERAATVSYTPRRYVTRAAGGRTGQVYLRNEQTVTVVAELPEIFRG